MEQGPELFHTMYIAAQGYPADSYVPFFQTEVQSSGKEFTVRVYFLGEADPYKSEATLERAVHMACLIETGTDCRELVYLFGRINKETLQLKDGLTLQAIYLESEDVPRRPHKGDKPRYPSIETQELMSHLIPLIQDIEI